MSGVGEEQQRVADIMAETWIAFARNGRPDNPLIPEWPPHDLDSRPVMVLDYWPASQTSFPSVCTALFENLERREQRLPG